MDRTYPAGKTVVWREITVGTHGQKDKLVLKLEGADQYLLLEEINADFRGLSNEWTAFFELFRNNGAALEVILSRLLPLLQKYMQRVS